MGAFCSILILYTTKNEEMEGRKGDTRQGETIPRSHENSPIKSPRTGEGVGGVALWSLVGFWGFCVFFGGVWGFIGGVVVCCECIVCVVYLFFVSTSVVWHFIFIEVYFLYTLANGGSVVVCWGWVFTVEIVLLQVYSLLFCFVCVLGCSYWFSIVLDKK